MNWKELFDEDRLDRGYNYYIQDKVYDVILTDDSITSKVEGSRSNIYEVKINFKDDDIDSLYCTCPYYYTDFNCKHMVATLYKMEEIVANTKSNIEDKNYDEESLFTNLMKTIDETKLRRFIYERFKTDKDFMEAFINEFQEEFTPEDFDNYENMLENIFNIDVVELYNENGFFQEAPFHKYLENFINDKISLLYKNQEYDYVRQLLYIIYENISEKVDVTQYIEIDNILKSCNYYMERVIENQEKVENDEIFNYLINKIRYDYNYKTTKYFIDLLFAEFDSKNYLKELNSTIDELLKNENNLPDEILLAKYELLKKLEYPEAEQYIFLQDNKNNEKLMDILIEYEINHKNLDKAIELLNENKQLHGKTHSLENTIKLLSLYNVKKDNENAIKELKTILYDFNVKDMYFIKQLKELCEEKQWSVEKDNLVEFYENNYSYDFLNELYVEEKEYDNLFDNITTNCNIQLIEEYRQYYEDKYNDEILSIYNKYILEEAKTSKNISGYTLIIRFLDLMISYKNSSQIVIKLISILKNKYSQRKLFMEKLDEFMIINSLKC